MHQTVTLIALTALLLPTAVLAARERVEVLQNQLEHPWALAFLPDDRGILITLRGGSSSSGSATKASRRRSRAYRRSGLTGRAVCWTWRWHRTLPSRAGSG